MKRDLKYTLQSLGCVRHAAAQIFDAKSSNRGGLSFAQILVAD